MPTRGSCSLPPDGWFCTLQAGHKGPCPAHRDVHEFLLGLTTAEYLDMIFSVVKANCVQNKTRHPEDINCELSIAAEYIGEAFIRTAEILRERPENG